MVQILKYVSYLLVFFLMLHVLVWVKYSAMPEERTTKTERKLSYEEADILIKGTIKYKDVEYFEEKNSVVKITADWFPTFNYDTLNSSVNYFSRDK